MANSYFQWTPPQQGTHPRLVGNATDVTTWQSRIASTHSGFWSSLLTYCNAHLGDDPSSIAGQNSSEYLACHSFATLVGGNTTYADKAIETALWIAAQGYPSEWGTRRRYLQSMAVVYDWSYARLTTSERDSLRRRMWDYVQAVEINPAEYLWGHAHGYIPHFTEALIAIMEDGDATQNAAWRAKMDELMDHWYDGTNSNFFAGFRYFGADGGSHKGSGSGCYQSLTLEFYRYMFPSVSKSLGLDWWTSEDWYTQLVWWMVWHWREDRQFHKMECEIAPTSYYKIPDQVYAAMIADRNDNITGEVAQWLYNEIENRGTYRIWGPHEFWNVIWFNPSRVSTQPTVASLGKARDFDKVGHTCVRTGWDAGQGTSWVAKYPRAFTGGHQKNTDGSFSLCHLGVPFFRDNGLYDPDIYYSYKIPGDSQQTGHRWSYDHRSISASVGRIYDSNEISENVVDSFQTRLSSDTKFGVKSGGVITVSNVGEQLWPKTTKYQPDDLADILAESKWNFAGKLAYDNSDPLFTSLDADLTERYYASKCTKYHRRWLWVEPDAFPTWNWPVLLLWDDLTVHSDAVGNEVYVYQLQTGITPTGSAAELVFTQGTAKLWHKVLKPSSVAYSVVTGFYDLDSVEYPATHDHIADDNQADGSDAKRIEIHPTATLTSIEFLAVFFPADTDESSLPSLTLVDDASYLGVTIDGVDCKFVRGAPYGAVVGDTGDSTPPAAPGTPSPTAGSGFVDLDWADNSEPDLKDYDVYRSTQL